ncbi:MAG: aspartate aminotransferase, partial [Deltaproteobacteria bacterium]|nr:aspartate aminotransferase [Deltaproteobacteria bacterium]
MRLSKRVLNVQASETLKAKQKALALKEQGIHVIDLSAGEPSFSTPDKIKTACKKAIDENYSYYAPV